MQIPITGPAYVHASQDVNFQRCVNQYLVDAGPKGRGADDGVLIPAQGKKLLYDAGESVSRGMIEALGKIYHCVGNEVYEHVMNPDTGTIESSTVIGTIPGINGLVKMAYSSTQLMIVTQGLGFVYNFTTHSYTQITSPSFEGASYVVFLQGYFIVCNPNSNRMQHSDLNDALSWDPLDSATAESHPDNIVALASNRGELWVFGETSVEIWDNVANPTGFAFSPLEGAGMDTGCSAPFSVTSVDNRLMWLDSNGRVALSDAAPYIRNNNTGYTIKVVSTDAISNELSTYSRLVDITAMQYIDRGHIMWQMTSTVGNRTWVFDYNTGVWHERSYINQDTNLEEYDLVQFFCKIGRNNIGTGIRDGKMYLMSHTYKDDAGVPISRIRTTAILNDEFNIRVVDELIVRLQTGMAPITGNGAEPVISLRYSNNGGYTWSQYISRSLGNSGEYAKMVIWNRMGYGREWILEFKIMDPVDYSIIDASAKVR